MFPETGLTRILIVLHMGDHLRDKAVFSNMGDVTPHALFDTPALRELFAYSCAAGGVSLSPKHSRLLRRPVHRRGRCWGQHSAKRPLSEQFGVLQGGLEREAADAEAPRMG